MHSLNCSVVISLHCFHAKGRADGRPVHLLFFPVSRGFDLRLGLRPRIKVEGTGDSGLRRLLLPQGIDNFAAFILFDYQRVDVAVLIVPDLGNMK